VSFKDILAATERATGRRYEPHSRGTVEDLQGWVADRRREGDDGSVAMGVYLLYMLTGQTRLDDLQNDRYPDIQPTTLDNLPL